METINIICLLSDKYIYLVGLARLTEGVFIGYFRALPLDSQGLNGFWGSLKIPFVWFDCWAAKPLTTIYNIQLIKNIKDENESRIEFAFNIRIKDFFIVVYMTEVNYSWLQRDYHWLDWTAMCLYWLAQCYLWQVILRNTSWLQMEWECKQLNTIYSKMLKVATIIDIRWPKLLYN